MYIDVSNVSVNFAVNQKKQTVLDQVSLGIEKGEFVCILGPSGCGKSTLLNAMAGFLKPSSGEIQIDGKKVERPSIRNVTIFQNYGLLPWRTVEKNVELGLETKKLKKEEKKELALKYLKMVGLEGSVDKYPSQLSGGMQQRVSIARALAVEPDILFMDEPFGALDAIIRMKLQEDIRRIATETKKTIVFVTHDSEEAVYLSDRIVVMEGNHGKNHTVIPVDLPKNRNRTSDDFILIRDRVYDTLHMKYEKNIEYYL